MIVIKCFTATIASAQWCSAEHFGGGEVVFATGPLVWGGSTIFEAAVIFTRHFRDKLILQSDLAVSILGKFHSPQYHLEICLQYSQDLIYLSKQIGKQTRPLL